MYDAVISNCGSPGTTIEATGTDVAQLLTGYGVDITRGGYPAIAVLVTVETNAARIKFGPSAGKGHVIAAAGSYMGYGPEVVKALKICNATAASAATLQITPFF